MPQVHLHRSRQVHVLHVSVIVICAHMQYAYISSICMLYVVEQAGGQCLACVMDIRYEDQVARAIKQAVEKFGGIDILVNNAGAINLSGTLDTTMKKYGLSGSYALS